MEQSYPSAPGEKTQGTGSFTDRPGEANEGQGDGHRIRDTADRLAHEARERAASAAEHVRESAGSVLRSRKETTADRLHGVAGSFRDVGERLHEQQDDAAAQLVEFAAEQIDCWSSYLRQRDIEELKMDAENLARRHPSIFLGGAFIAGLALGRFMRSSAPRPEHDHDMEYSRQGEWDRPSVGSGYAGYQPQTSSSPRAYGEGTGGAGMGGAQWRSPGDTGTGSGQHPQGAAWPPAPGQSTSRPLGSESPRTSGPAETGKPLSDERSTTPGHTPGQPNPPHGTGAP